MTSLSQWVDRNATSKGETTAWIFLDAEGREAERYSHADIARHSRRMATYLAQLGPEPVVLMAEPGLDYLMAILACRRAGRTFIPLPPARKAQAETMNLQLRRLMEECEAGLVLASGLSLQSLEEARGQWQWGKAVLMDLEQLKAQAALATDGAPEGRTVTPAGLLYTSGSTALPKGVCLSEEALVYNAVSCCEAWQIDDGDTLVSWMPNHHSFGLIYNLLLPLFSGARLVAMAPASFIAQPKLWLQALSKYRGTHSAAATFGYKRCCEKIEDADAAGLDLSAWRVGLVSAEPIHQGVYDRFLQRFRPFGLRPEFFCALYGLSETGPITSMPIAQTPLWFEEPGKPRGLALACVGAPLEGTRIICVDPESGQRTEPGTQGELWVRGPSLMEGYYRREEANRKVLCRRKADGPIWFRTGDLGFQDEAGRIFVTGRHKEMIIRHGKNYYPSDLEWVARATDPQLEHAAAAAFEDLDSGEAVLVMESGGVDTEQLEAWAMAIAARIARTMGMNLDRIVFTPAGSIPKTASGKIKRKGCLQDWRKGVLPAILDKPLCEPGPQAPAAATVMGAAEAAVIALIQSLVPDGLLLDSDFELANLPLDSVALIALAGTIEQQLGRPCHPSLFFQVQTLGELCQSLEASP